jgi:hypothetical protein
MKYPALKKGDEKMPQNKQGGICSCLEPINGFSNLMDVACKSEITWLPDILIAIAVAGGTVYLVHKWLAR